jgi:drug/metabolite transporter (DMT)-like permease
MMPMALPVAACPPLPSRARPGLSAEARGFAFGAAVALSGGSYLALGRAGIIGGFGVADLTLLRFGVAALVLLPALLRAGLPDLGGIGWRRVLALAFCAGPLFSLLQAGGFLFAPLVHGAVVMPAGVTGFGMLFGTWLLGERAGPGRLVGAAVMLAGLLLLGGEGLLTAGTGSWIGDLMFLGAALLWASYTVLLRRWRIDALRATAAVSAVSLVAFLPLWLAIAGWRHALAFPLPALLLQAVGQGLIAGVVLVVAFGRAVLLLGVGRAALFPALVPAVAMLVGVPLTGEWPDPLQAAGLGLVSFGLLIAIGAFSFLGGRR